MEEKKSNGALIGLVIVIIILIIGGIYMWQTNKDGMGNSETIQSETLTNQDAAALDALDQEAQTTDANAGVDLEAVN